MYSDNSTDENVLELLINYYVGDDFYPSRWVAFDITKACLENYLRDTKDERSIKEFLDTYDSRESGAVYEYAANDNRVLSENIYYSDAFLKEYNDFITPHLGGEEIPKEAYYWSIYSYEGE